MKILELKNISFAYGNKDVLNAISLDIAEGDFISIIGPNGSGKSTLIKIINNIYQPKTGEVLLRDKIIGSYKIKDIAKEISLVPQEVDINYDFTVEDIVAMGRYAHLKTFGSESEEDYKIIEEAMILTNVYGLKDRKVTEISGGEKQRTMIAKAIAQDSNIILLDEPTSSLDMNHQIEIMEFLTKLNKEKKLTVITVLHDVNLASRYSNKLILIKDGRIIDRGSPEEVITEENMRDAYNLEAAIDLNRYTNKTYLVPLKTL